MHIKKILLNLLTQEHNLRLAIHEAHHHVAGVGVCVHEPRVKNLLGKDAQNLAVNVGQRHARGRDAIAVANLDGVHKLGSQHSLAGQLVLDLGRNFMSCS